MADIELDNLVKIFPFQQVKGLFHRRQKQQLLLEQKSMPYTTNEGVVVLQKVSAKIREGEFVVLLGPSGCGKTTLLRLIAGLEDPTLGEIRFDGVNVNTLPPEERDVAMVFQNYSLYPHLTVYDNIAFPLRTAHMPREQLEQTVLEMAELLDMEPWLNRLPAELSGGQLQRVAIARALVRKPQVFLMDEPFSNLDAPLRSELRRLVKRIHGKLGTTFLYVTHDHNEALSLGQRILVMRDGMIEQDGTPADIYSRPRNTYVASTIGSPPMNLYDRKVWTTLDAAPLPRDAETIGIRPVNIRPSPKGIQAVVSYTEPLGSETLVHLQAGQQALTALWEAEEAERILRGQTVTVSFPSEKLHYFDKNGIRL